MDTEAFGQGSSHLPHLRRATGAQSPGLQAGHQALGLWQEQILDQMGASSPSLLGQVWPTLTGRRRYTSPTGPLALRIKHGPRGSGLDGLETHSGNLST